MFQNIRLAGRKERNILCPLSSSLLSAVVPVYRLINSNTTTASVSTTVKPSQRTCDAINTIKKDPSESLFDKILIANRGEIACRIIRTCQKLGIRTVAIYSNVDGPHCAHAKQADEAYPIGTGPSPTESYLQQDEIIALAQRSGAQAIHPGYGFLSENANFCNSIQTATDLVFIGPHADAITAMGSKSHSKALMEAAGVPTTPGFYQPPDSGPSHDPIRTPPQDVDLLYHQAVHHVGFPLLIKAVAGGGGKGMRLVHTESEFREALSSCQRESQSAFGNAFVLLEKYLIRPRHVEVQIIADTHGNTIHLFERDCSLQRRHQKIIEEAPPSDLDWSLRQKLGEMGIRAAQAVNYVNAGTVEFLLDTMSLTKQPDNPDFYFCEMNTRLQVEHPVTELITGIDLVEWQIRIAAGQVLPIPSQEDIHCTGHAMEARIYAEQPARNFIPATGTVWHHRPPTSAQPHGYETARVDTALLPGQTISVHYDPMIAKLIVHGKDRKDALKRLIKALKEYQIAGVPTNIDFLIKCASHPVFGQPGAVNTGFLEDHPVGTASTISPNPLAKIVGAFVAMLYLEQRISDSSNSNNHARSPVPWSTHWGSWRMGTNPCHILYLDNGGQVACTSHRDGSFDIGWTEKATEDSSATEQSSRTITHHISGSLIGTGETNVVVDGTRNLHLTTALLLDKDLLRICMWPRGMPNENDYYWSVDVILHPTTIDSRMVVTGADAGNVVAPMPGKITRIQCVEGDIVSEGDVVVVLEAMKMEHACLSLCSGVVQEIRCQVDDIVEDGVVLMVVKDEKDL